MQRFPYALEKPIMRGVIKSQASDFFVAEQLGFSLHGEGTHVWLYIEKKESNTSWVAEHIAKYAAVKPVAIGFAGLKDRQAVTRQWFSVNMAGKAEPDWLALNSDKLRVLQVERHDKKLKRGGLSHNQFEIVVRDLTGDAQMLSERLKKVQLMGFPNYFGPQRFGNNNSNINQALVLFRSNKPLRKTRKQGIYYSAARSWIFNHVLAQRVSQKTWDQALVGDVAMLDGCQSVFLIETLDETVTQRMAHFDIHPTGPMWGVGRQQSGHEPASIEAEIGKQYADLADGLVRQGVASSRRSFRAQARSLDWLINDQTLRLSFTLDKGCYATTLLRELIDFGES